MNGEYETMLQKLKYRFLKNKKNSSLFLGLTLLGFVSKLFLIYFPFGLTLSLASLFLFLILFLYGPKIALLITLLINILSIPFSGTLSHELFPIIEIIFLIIINLYRTEIPRFNYLTILLIGIDTLVTIFYVLLINKTNYGSALYFYLIMGGFNIVLNFFLANLFVTYLPFSRITNGRKNKVNIKQILIHFSTMTVLVVFFIFTIIHCVEFIKSTKQELISNGNHYASQIKTDLSNWNSEEVIKLKLGGTIQCGYLERTLKLISKNSSNNIIITNNQNIILASNKAFPQNEHLNLYDSNNYDRDIVTSNVTRVTPNNQPLRILKYIHGYYLTNIDLKSYSIKMYIKTPIRPYIYSFINYFLNQLLYLLVFICLAFLFSFLLNNILVRTINKLAMTTSGLPKRIKNQEEIHWPSTNIYEVSFLTKNFLDMSINIKTLFNETEVANRKLLDQANKLKASERKLERLAYHDPLTDLPNRQYFQKFIGEARNNAILHREKMAIVFLDLDQFKQINDTLGHSMGDELLKYIANNLIELENPHSKIFRLGGDEFVIVIDGDTVSKEISKISNNLQEFFKKPISIDDETLHLTCSAGISLFPENGYDIETLIQNADIAMYESKKQSGTCIQYFRDEMKLSLLNRNMLIYDLREAIKNQDFELYYQPKVNQEVKTITSIEALIRWRKSNLIIPPSQFISVAEETGLITKIDEWVIKEACKQNKKWQEQGYPAIQVSVNISANHFYDGSLLDLVKNALLDTQLNPKYLQLEMTENVFINDFEKVSKTIIDLKKLGVSISIDDFGKGYSSLSHLLTLPINEVKLDKFFIQNINNDKRKEAVVKQTIKLSRDLNYKIVAEGVETIEELHYLRQMGCDEYQGYLFSKPLPHCEMEKLFNKESILHHG